MDGSTAAPAIPSEALAGYEELRTRLAEELGLDPSPELAGLQRAMLRQDPELGATGQDLAPFRTRTHILAPFSTLVGREDEVAAVRKLLGNRRVTNSGPIGLGFLGVAVILPVSSGLLRLLRDLSGRGALCK
ncbi:signal transduction response regulator [Streptomyces sp. NL15-2K]|nr:BTAD domain-containing putative transcriptional regulator [Kutzneria buriramensis]WKX11053.1 BTAD domain-containing putative transcriptional regulator [Kutzneria buriramensis]GCB52084.1 signal transduction response regulator [Streptomyces sp. NL15-2K]